jgi:uncharacterized protein
MHKEVQMKQHILVLSCLLLLIFSSVCHGASFDCKKANTSTEKFICRNDELSRADDTLTSTYNTHLKFLSPEAKKNLKKEQKAWLGKRDKDCRLSEDAKTNMYGLDKSCLRKMYEQREKELETKIPGLLRLDVKPPQDLQLLISKKIESLLPSYYYRISDHEYILYGYDLSYVDTKKGLVNEIIGQGDSPSILGAIRGNGITWLIITHGRMHQGIESGGYQAIMIKDKKSSNEPYQLFDLAFISSFGFIDDKFNPCLHLDASDEETDNSFSGLKGYDVKDLNGDGINDMVFHFKEFDCKNNKHTSITETYYFLPKEPYIEKREQKFNR